MAVISIQCGNYANYVGAHFWNIQDSDFVYNTVDSGASLKYNTTDHDVLYREGVNLARQPTYTPRLVALDLKGSLGTLPELGELYGGAGIPKSSVSSWSGGVDIVKSEPIRKNQFLQDLDNVEAGDDEGEGEKDKDTCEGKGGIGTSGEGYDLDGEVKCWSDYLYTRFHPKSVLVVESYQHENSTHPFDMFGLGRSLWNDSHQEVGEETEDRIRFFAEECDKLQGFHVLTDMSTAFSGFSSRLNCTIVDDYSGKGLVNFMLSPPGPTEFTFNRCAAFLANSALAIASVLEDGLVTPLSLGNDWFPLQNRNINVAHLQYKPDLHYHTSCILGSVIENCSLVYRQKEPVLHMADVIQGITAGHTNLAALSASMPVDTSGNKSFELDAFTKMTPLLPAGSGQLAGSGGCGAGTRRSGDLITLRGVLAPALHKHRSPEYGALSTPEEYLEQCAATQLTHSMPRLYCHTKPLKTSKPFPRLFSPNVSPDGQIQTKLRSENESVKFVPVMSSWTAGQAAASSLASLATRANKLNISKLPWLLDSGVESGEWSECVETLLSASENYNAS